MSRQSITRRVFLGALLALLAVVAAVGDGQIASADAKKARDYGSRAEFERACRRMGGTFVVERSGHPAYHFANGAIECNALGNDCWFYPEPEPGVFEEWPPDKIPGGVADVPSGWSGTQSGDIDIGPDTQVAGP